MGVLPLSSELVKVDYLVLLRGAAESSKTFTLLQSKTKNAVCSLTRCLVPGMAACIARRICPVESVCNNSWAFVKCRC